MVADREHVGRRHTRFFVQNNATFGASAEVAHLVERQLPKL